MYDTVFRACANGGVDGHMVPGGNISDARYDFLREVPLHPEIPLNGTAQKSSLAYAGLLPGRIYLRGRVPGDPSPDVNGRIFSHNPYFFITSHETKRKIPVTFNKKLLFLNLTI